MLDAISPRLPTRIFFVLAVGLITELLLSSPLPVPEGKGPHVVFLIGEREYRTNETLPSFAEKELIPRGVRVSYVLAHPKRLHYFPNIELIADADLVFLSIRRRNPPLEQLSLLKEYLDKGHPLVGIRTTSHAFGLRRRQPPPKGHTTWENFDQEVLGATYRGHLDKESANMGKCFFEINRQALQHPILKGLTLSCEVTRSSLYRSNPLMESTTVLAYGGITDRPEREPVAWINQYKNASIFYTSLGHPQDFNLPIFRQLLINGIFWALGEDVPEIPKKERPYGAPGAR